MFEYDYTGYNNLMHILILALAIILVLNLFGGMAYPTYASGPYYTPSLGTILLVLFLCWVFGVR